MAKPLTKDEILISNHLKTRAQQGVWPPPPLLRLLELHSRPTAQKSRIANDLVGIRLVLDHS